MSAPVPTFGYTATAIPAPALEDTFTVPISVAAIGPTVIRAGVADRRWVIKHITLVATGAVSVTLRSGANNITGAMALVANGQLQAGDGDRTILRALNTNESFSILLSGAVQVSGWVQMAEFGLR